MNSSEYLLSCCASLCEGDGISPRHEKNRENKPQSDNKRLCKRVHRIVRLAIVELGLDGWDVVNVKPYNNSSSLVLEITPTRITNAEQCSEVITWFQQHQGRIRTIVAQAIHRKNVPSLHIELARES
jgi:ribosome-binding factor A